AENGSDVDLELALFEAERGDPQIAVRSAEAEIARRSSVHVYDALAWARYQAGDYSAARDASRQELRLGTDEGLMLFHAGMIDRALGDATGARANLQLALA